MIPATVRAGQLHVGKSVRRVVLGDQRPPRGRHAEERAEAVFDLQPLAHLEVVAQEFEAHRSGRQPGEVARLGKEGEYLLDGAGDELAGR